MARAGTTTTLFASFLSKKKEILLTALLIWVFTVLIITTFPRSYRAQALVVPAETTGIATSSLLSSYPMFGPALIDPKPTGNFAVYLAALRSREIATELKTKTRLASLLEEERKSNIIVRALSALRLCNPEIDDDMILAWLERHSSATPHPSTILWVIEVRHPDRTLALEALRTIHEAAENRVRQEMVAMVDRRLAWLIERAVSENDTTVRNTLYDLIGQAQRHAAILAADTAIAARLVSAPAVEGTPSLPNYPFLFALLFLSSITISTLLWALISTASSVRRQTQFSENVCQTF